MAHEYFPVVGVAADNAAVDTVAAAGATRAEDEGAAATPPRARFDGVCCHGTGHLR